MLRSLLRRPLAVAAPSAAVCLARSRCQVSCAASEKEPAPPPEEEPWVERVAEALDEAVDLATSAVGFHPSEETLEELEEGPGRYAAYARRIAQVFLAKGRLVAYTSDMGESFRPVVPRWVVRAAYGVTWAYVAVDVTYHTAEEHVKGSAPMTVLRTAVHAATFQSIASVLVPSILIHQVVHTADHAARRLPAGFVARWIPSLVGLACIPLMPYIDVPVEHLIDAGFERVWPKVEAEQGGAAEKEKKTH